VPAIPQWAVDRGGWGVAFLLLIAFVFALSRGILVRGSEVAREAKRIADEVDRRERERERDVDRVIALYVKQLDVSHEAGRTKDITIEKQAAQIEKLMAHSAVSAHALAEIMEEARRRGLVS
jgi:hypothetical protein